jgi:hypothetical protein
MSYDPSYTNDWVGEAASDSPWSLFRSLFPPAPQDRQDAAQGANAVVVAALGGLVLVLIQLIFSPLASVLNREPGKLENNPMCGITTGGQVGECIAGPVIICYFAGRVLVGL